MKLACSVRHPDRSAPTVQPEHMSAIKASRAKVAQQESGAANPDSAQYKNVKIVLQERTHQQRVSTVTMDATNAAKESTALIQALSAPMLAAAHRVQKDGTRTQQAQLRAHSARKASVMGRATKEQATPDVSRYHQDHLLTPPTLLPNVPKVPTAKELPLA